MAGLGKLLKQAQKMQENVNRIQEELASRELEGTSGGGMVKVIAKGDISISSIKIDPKVVNPADVQMLEDLVLVAVKSALEAAKKLQSDELGKATSTFKVPGLDL